MRNIVRTTAVVLAGLLAATAWAGKAATVRLQQEGIALELTFDNRQKIVVTSKPAPIEPGTYNVKAVSLFKRDDKGRTWEMRVDGNLSTLGTVAVEPEQEKVIDAGEPIIYDIFNWVTGKTEGNNKLVLLRVTPYGKYSEVYCPGALLGGRRPPPPGFRITSVADGKLLAAGQLPAGHTGVSEYTWKVPKEFTGQVKVELTPVMGPFEWKYRTQEWNIK